MPLTREVAEERCHCMGHASNFVSVYRYDFGEEME